MKLKSLKLSESMQDYLETILSLEQDNKVARAKDIAERMGVLRGTVTGALKSLAEKGLINYQPYSFITLTPRGRAAGREITRRHRVIQNFLQQVLDLAPDSAEENACRMEHAMDRSAIDRLVQFIEYIQYCPRTGGDWVQGFSDYYSRRNHNRQDCSECIDACMERFRQESQDE